MFIPWNPLWYDLTPGRALSQAERRPKKGLGVRPANNNCVVGEPFAASRNPSLRHVLRAVVAFLIILASFGPASGDPRHEELVLRPSEPNAGQFGRKIAADGDTAIIGAPWGSNGGAAFAFVRSNGTWVEQAKLVPNVPAPDVASFGYSVALSGDTALVGGSEKVGGSEYDLVYVVYVFTRAGGNWRQQARLQHRDVELQQSCLGVGFSTTDTVAVSGDVAAIGDPCSARTFIFERSGAHWVEEQSFAFAPDPPNYLPMSVAASGSVVAVGASQQGTVSIYARLNASWVQREVLTSPDPDTTGFGDSVALWNDAMVVTAPWSDKKAAYEFSSVEGVWVYRATIPGPHVYWELYFATISLAGDILLVDGWSVFGRTANGWSRRGQIIAENRSSGGEGLGAAISGEQAIVGGLDDDDRPVAYVFSIVDRVAPRLVLTGTPSRRSGWSRAAFAYDVDDDFAYRTLLAVMCRLDDREPTPCPDGYWEPVDDGPHTFTVSATDPSGNTASASYEWTVDLTPPDTIITKAPPARSGDHVTIEFAADPTEPGVWFSCLLDEGTGWGEQSCSSPMTLGPLRNGRHRFSVRAYDDLGNFDETPAVVEWTVDLTQPETIITKAPANPSDEYVTIEFTTDPVEPGARFECAVDTESDWRPCTSPMTLGPLDDGRHSFSVHSYDEVGNVDQSPARVEWIVGDPPDTFLEETPSEPSGPDVTLRFRGEAHVGDLRMFSCEVDGGASHECTTPLTLSGLSSGTHTFSVRAVDSFGLVDPTPATFTWRVDAEGPATQITTPDGAILFHVAGVLVTPVQGLTNDNDAGVDRVVVTFTSVDGSEIQRVFNCTRQSCPWVVDPPPASGEWTVRAQAFDAVGNIGAETAPISIIVVAA